MQIPLALLADYANVSAEGKLNIMGIFDTIFVPGGFPTTHAQMRLIFRYLIPVSERGSTKTIDIRLLNADGVILLGLNSTMKIPDDLPTNQEIPQILELNGLVFPEPGEYAFSILVGGDEKARVPFRVVPMAVPQGT